MSGTLGRLHVGRWLVCGLLLLAMGSCSLIDDDLADCGTDYELDYELQLVTNMTTELQTQLQTDVTVSNALRAHLSDIFSDFAHDVDLSFYDTEGDSTRLHHEEHIMDANQSSYTLYLPMRQYMHLAVANVVDNSLVDIVRDETCHTATLLQLPGSTGAADTIDSHTTGIFTARQEMHVLEGVDQTFNVHLYMANCATSLVLDARGYDVRDVRVYTTGFATGFDICDSVYTFSPVAPVVRTTQLPLEGTDALCFCSVNFPSPDLDEETRTVIETEEPFISAHAADALWQYRIYATLADGSVTESVLNMTKPLRAGQVKVVKAHFGSDGRVEPEDQSVGVSIRLNWNENNYPDIPL